MGLWLFKEEPEHYNYADLERDGDTLWDGVTNNLARQNLRKVRKGDRILYYHTAGEKAIVGEMRGLRANWVGRRPAAEDAHWAAKQVSRKSVS